MCSLDASIKVGYVILYNILLADKNIIQNEDLEKSNDPQYLPNNLSSSNKKKLEAISLCLSSDINNTILSLKLS